MKPKVHARRRYLVNKQIQLTYSLYLILTATLMILIYGTSLWFLNKVHLELFQKIVGEDALPKSYIASIQNQFAITVPLAIVAVSCLLLVLGILD